MGEDLDFESMTEEQAIIARELHKFYESSSNLDAYQLEVLLGLPTTETGAEAFRPKWESLLREKQKAE